MHQAPLKLEIDSSNFQRSTRHKSVNSKRWQWFMQVISAPLVWIWRHCQYHWQYLHVQAKGILQSTWILTVPSLQSKGTLSTCMLYINVQPKQILVLIGMGCTGFTNVIHKFCALTALWTWYESTTILLLNQNWTLSTLISSFLENKYKTSSNCKCLILGTSYLSIVLQYWS